MSWSFYLSSDNAATFDAYDRIGGVDLSGATVTITLTDGNGNQVAGETWPLSMGYVGTTTTDMDGNAYSTTRYRFRATLADTLTMVNQARYTGTISFDGGTGRQRTLQVPIVAKTGTGTN